MQHSRIRRSSPGHYFRASKKAKTEMLNEFVATTGMHRKAVIRLLNRRSRSSGSKKRGHPRLYRHEAMVALKVAWEASDCLCSKRLQPFLPELAGILKRCGELTMMGETEAQLCQMGASTIDRLLRRWRENDARRGLNTTKPGTLLKNSIPRRTFSDWNENKPGFLGADLVAHCGDSAEGFYRTTPSTMAANSSIKACMTIASVMASPSPGHVPTRKMIVAT